MIEYDPHLWRTTFFAIRGSMVRVISFRALLVTVAAFVITLLHELVVPLSVPAASAVHGIVGPALGLLLVFRTNQSYDRWWEGRKLWGSMVNTCRNVARTSAVHLQKDSGRLARVLALTSQFPAATMAVLRGKAWAPEGLEPDDAAAVTAHNHAPTAICWRITHHLKAARDAGVLSDFVMVELDRDPHLLVDIVGACERIHKTPLPFAYVVHLRRALVIFCATLPFALLGSFGWSTVPIVMAVSYVMLGIEEIGVEIEDPFEGDDNDLPLEKITAGIQANVGSYAPRTS